MVKRHLLSLDFSWKEDYGNNPGKVQQNTMGKDIGRGNRMCSTLSAATITVWRSPYLLSLCDIISFFEGAMYVFVFHWTPALQSLDLQPENEAYEGPP
mmetsp:Transcript_36726/g.74931  ORF Transcript_36726/g.74931 Transcript_36726/m.74931 type:complete len:98 (+) Transcript_36726:91-384(+)